MIFSIILIRKDQMSSNKGQKAKLVIKWRSQVGHIIENVFAKTPDQFGQFFS